MKVALMAKGLIAYTISFCYNKLKTFGLVYTICYIDNFVVRRSLSVITVILKICLFFRYFYLYILYFSRKIWRGGGGWGRKKNEKQK